MKILRVLPAVIVFSYLLLPASLAQAMAAPDTAPSITAAKVYENALETGDVYLVAKYNMAYTVLPTDPASTTFILRLIDSSNSTELGAATPYSYKNLGYSLGLISIYWPAASTSKPVWGSNNYTLRLEGNPTITWTPSTPIATLASSSFIWQTSSSTSDTSYYLGLDIESLATEIGSYWNVSLLTPVNTGGVNGNVFTTSGEDYFSNAIPALRTIVPSLYAINSVPVSYTDSVHPQTRASTLKQRRASLGLYEGTVWGIPADVVYALASIAISLILAALTAAALAPLGGAMAQVGGGVVGSSLMLGFIPLLATNVGTLSAIVEGLLAFISVIAIGLWLAGHLGRMT